MGKALRPRFNDRARSRKAIGMNSTAGVPATDSTLDEIGGEGVADNRPAVEELIQQTGISRAKRKRLEKYIDQKLKKEKRVQLISQLSQSNFQSDLLTTSRDLGRGKETTRERLRRALKEERAGIDLGTADTSELIKERYIDENAVESYCHESGSSEDEKQQETSWPDQIIISDIASRQTVADIQLETSPSSVQISKIEGVKNQGDDQLATEVTDNPAYTHRPGRPLYIPVKRKDAIQQARLQLPILGEEQRIMELIAQNDVVVLCGETGSGKTTQLPQFLYEAGYGNPQSEKHSGMIGVTEPRRMAAISMAKRVADEMGLDEKTVSYQVRYDGTASDRTVVKFMTDGILLKEISNDFLLQKYSCLIIDEAHERSLNTDILIGLLSRIVVLRGRLCRGEISENQLPAHMRAPNTTSGGSDELQREQQQQLNVQPLKLIIMSATLQVRDFTENKRLFPQGSPPVCRIDARQYPVTVHFNRRTAEDYVDAAYRKICKIHTQLPANGGILVFLPGRLEIMTLCRRLRVAFPTKYASRLSSDATLLSSRNNRSIRSDGSNYAGMTELGDEEDGEGEDDELDNNLNSTQNGCRVNDDFDDLQDFSEEEEEISEDEAAKETPPSTLSGTNSADNSINSIGGLHVLPLYSLMSTSDQMRVFAPPPPGSRLCVVATNVAETSLTIPGITYVVDSGKAKERRYDIDTSVASFNVDFTSKASASQRAGRAGRTGPGHCYRLFSSAAFGNVFADFSRPEIQRMPIDGVVLHMKQLGIDNILNFPFPTPPDREQLLAAETLLIKLKALDPKTKRITTDGRLMVRFPVAPRFARMLITAAAAAHELDELKLHSSLLEYTIAMVAAISASTDPFMPRSNDGDENNDSVSGNANGAHRALKQFSKGLESDSLVLLRIVGAYEYSADKEKFCRDFNIREKAMRETQQLRSQLTRICLQVFPDCRLLDHCNGARMKPLQSQDVYRLHEILLSGYIDQLAMRSDDPLPPTNDSASTSLAKHAKKIYYLPLTACTYRESILNQPIFIHQDSCLSRTAGRKDFPRFIIYGQLMQQQQQHQNLRISEPRIQMRNLTAINPAIIAKIGAHLCRWGRPLDHPEPYYCTTKHRIMCYSIPTFGDRQLDLQPVAIEYPLGGSGSGSAAGDCARYFAKALLDGQVFQQLEPLSKSLRYSSSLFTNRKVPVVHSKVMNLVLPLCQRQIRSRDDLIKCLREQPLFLLAGMVEWYEGECHSQLRAIWKTLI